MISANSINEWSAGHPWSRKSFVEQDLVICRALVAIFSDDFLRENLAFRGGTALHKLYLSPQSRYSEDIDLVQVKAGAIKPIVERLDEVLSWLPGKTFEQRRFGFRMKFRYESEIMPVESMRIKLEVNTSEHFAELGYVEVPFSVQNSWFSGGCGINTYWLDELMGSKLRAMYQRRKGRDLYDMHLALNSGKVDVDRLLQCWRRFMLASCGSVPSQKEFVANMELKLAMSDYQLDTMPILRDNIEFDVKSAWCDVFNRVISRI